MELKFPMAAGDRCNGNSCTVRILKHHGIFDYKDGWKMLV
jgi:hypothetical protein